MKINVQLQPELGCDSANYDVITRGVEKSLSVYGACCEIGLRKGEGSKFIGDVIIQHNKQTEKILIAIDPYGNIAYEENGKIIHCDYTNQMRNDCMVNMYLYAQQGGINFYFYNMTDEQFFKRFPDGLPCHIEGENEETILNTYSFVHFDDPHSIPPLKKEIRFFHERTDTGAVYVFDDAELYAHDIIDKYLIDLGWERYERILTMRNQKWAYVKK